MLGGLKSVAGGTRNHAGWAWLTGSRVVQHGNTPLHLAAVNGHEAAIKLLVAAKADLHVKANVRGGVLGGRGGGRRRVCMLLLWLRILNLRFWSNLIRQPPTQSYTLKCTKA